MVVRTVGMIKDPFEANNIVINKDADMVAMARAFLSNPRWVWDAKAEATIPVKSATVHLNSMIFYLKVSR